MPGEFCIKTLIFLMATKCERVISLVATWRKDVVHRVGGGGLFESDQT